VSSSAEPARSRRPPRKWPRRRPVRPAQIGGATRYLAVGGLAVAAIPLLLGDAILIRRLVFVLVLSLVAISLDFTYSFTGELALGQVGVYAAGAYAAAVLMTRYHLSFWAAAGPAALVAAVVGLLAASPGLRVGSWYFALTSLFIAVVIPDVITQMSGLTGGSDGLAGIPRPSLFGHQLGMTGLYILLVVLLLILYVMLRNLAGSLWGLAFSSVQRSSHYATSIGISILRVKVFTYALAAVVAGLAGAVFGTIDGYLSPATFPLSLSVLILAGLVIGGMGTFAGAIIGVGFLQLLPDFTSAVQRYSLLLYGGLLVGFMLVVPNGVVTTVGGFARRLLPHTRLAASKRDVSPDADHDATPDPWTLRGPLQPATLHVSGVSKSFGGNRALMDVSLVARPGTVTAIIGPNGSGKTTLLNVVCAVYPRDGGDVRLESLALHARRPNAVAEAGVARTFQTPIVVGGRSTLENVMCGSFMHRKSSMLGCLLGIRRARTDRSDAQFTSAALLALVGLQPQAARDATELTLGQQRRLEIARALATQPTVLLLDEPCAGLIGSEIDEIAEVLDGLRQANFTVVLVEHNVQLVMEVADNIVVLDQGRLLASGTPAEIAANELVIASYLGEGLNA
jgi:branched-chain amino acid transport system permease protein